MDPDRGEWWAPEYEYQGFRPDGSRIPRTFTVDGVSSAECPVSRITPESRKMLDLISRNMRTRDAAGAVLFGTDTQHWPAWWWDAVTIAEAQKLAADEARMNAES